MLNIIILDDLPEQITYIKSIVNKTNREMNIQTYQEVDTFLKDLDSFNEYTIFILDIVLDKHSGIDLAKVINEYALNPIIIFVSAFLNKATEVYETEHCYFVYKAEIENRLPKAIDKACKVLQEIKTTLVIHKKDGTIIVPIKDILYLERNKRTTIIQCSNEAITCSQKLDQLLPLLSDSFIQCHRSYIIHLHKVKKYTTTSFTMIDGTSISISRNFYQKTKERWLSYLKNRV